MSEAKAMVWPERIKRYLAQTGRGQITDVQRRRATKKLKRWNGKKEKANVEQA